MRSLPYNAERGKSLNESPSKKEGKSARAALPYPKTPISLNESPSKKEGKWSEPKVHRAQVFASMKALPKRKGNWGHGNT